MPVYSAAVIYEDDGYSTASVLRFKSYISGLYFAHRDLLYVHQLIIYLHTHIYIVHNHMHLHHGHTIFPTGGIKRDNPKE